MLVAAYPSMYSLSSWEVPALERLAGIQSKPVLKKGLGSRLEIEVVVACIIQQPSTQTEHVVQVRA